MCAGSLLFAAGAIAVVASEGASVWAVLCIPLFGLAGVLFAYQLATGRPRLKVSRTGLTFDHGREVAFHEVRELYTSTVSFGIAYPPGPTERLRGPWQRRLGLKYSRIVARGVVDSFVLARWVAQLAGVSADELEGEPRFGRSVWVWRLPQRGSP